jgi:hypothetical protein
MAPLLPVPLPASACLCGHRLAQLRMEPSDQSSHTKLLFTPCTAGGTYPPTMRCAAPQVEAGVDGISLAPLLRTPHTSTAELLMAKSAAYGQHAHCLRDVKNGYAPIDPFKTADSCTVRHATAVPHSRPASQPVLHHPPRRLSSLYRCHRSSLSPRWCGDSLVSPWP